MSPQQLSAFTQASGIAPSHLTFYIRLAVGGMAILVAILIIVGLMRYLDSNLAIDKTIFVISLFALLFSLMLIFMYIA